MSLELPVSLLPDLVFQASGREDVDVRMLGTGRPFAIEVVNPRSQVLTMDQCASLQATINATSSNVRVRDVQPTSKVDVALMHEGATAKRKQYLYVKSVTLNLVCFNLLRWCEWCCRMVAVVHTLFRRDHPHPHPVLRYC